MILDDVHFAHSETHVKLFYSESFGRFLGLVGFKKSFVVISYFFFTYCEKVIVVIYIKLRYHEQLFVTKSRRSE